MSAQIPRLHHGVQIRKCGDSPPGGCLFEGGLPPLSLEWIHHDFRLWCCVQSLHEEFGIESSARGNSAVERLSDAPRHHPCEYLHTGLCRTFDEFRWSRQSSLQDTPVTKCTPKRTRLSKRRDHCGIGDDRLMTSRVASRSIRNWTTLRW